jgi:hypothetical protein
MSNGFEKLKLLLFETILSLIGFSTALLMFHNLKRVHDLHCPIHGNTVEFNLLSIVHCVVVKESEL